MHLRGQQAGREFQKCLPRWSLLEKVGGHWKRLGRNELLCMHLALGLLRKLQHVTRGALGGREGPQRHGLQPTTFTKPVVRNKEFRVFLSLCQLLCMSPSLPPNVPPGLRTHAPKPTLEHVQKFRMLYTYGRGFTAERLQFF